jgi:transcriptional regulator with XRE-family HTH domain
MNYSKAIRITRSLADLSQNQLAVLADIDRSYLSMIESGRRVPSEAIVKRIAAALDVPDSLLDLLAKESGIKGLRAEQINQFGIELAKLLFEAKRFDESDQTVRP